MSKWLTLAEVASRLGVSRSRVAGMVQSRALLGGSEPGGWKVYVLRSHVEAILAGAMTLEGKSWCR